MKLLSPSQPVTSFTGKPAFIRTAKPMHGETMIRSAVFPNLLFPARFCSRSVVGEAVRTRRIE